MASQGLAPQASKRTWNALLVLITLASIAFGVFGISRAAWYRSHRLWAPSKRDVGPVKDRFLVEYYDSDVWENTNFLGVRSDQTPTDNWMFQEIITEVRPDYIIEGGTLYGGSALYFGLLQSVLGDGKVITIDIEPHVEKASQFKVWNERVELITGSTTDPKVVKKIAEEVRGKKVLVTLDDDHTAKHVREEMELYAPMVSVGSYMVVQDTAVNGHPLLPDFGPGPTEAVQDFMKTHDNFVVDRSREKFGLTFYPGGWLKRVR